MGREERSFVRRTPIKFTRGKRWFLTLDGSTRGLRPPQGPQSVGTWWEVEEKTGMFLQVTPLLIRRLGPAPSRRDLALRPGRRGRSVVGDARTGHHFSGSGGGSVVDWRDEGLSSLHLEFQTSTSVSERDCSPGFEIKMCLYRVDRTGGPPRVPVPLDRTGRVVTHGVTSLGSKGRNPVCERECGRHQG